MANGRSSQDERKLEGGAAPAPAPSTGLHPAFYIAYVVAGLFPWRSPPFSKNQWLISSQSVDCLEFQRHSVQQVGSVIRQVQ
jgi:hypothetical protein